ncbi:MAG: hypothetical protein AAGD28_26325 [Bacteroidota bacterium]
MKKILLLCISHLILSLSFSQTNPEACNCCSEAQKAFDFWIGEWMVYDTTGNKIGENNILSMQNHCVLQENWKSANSTGTSYNYYNQQDKSWNQLWVDNQGNPLVLKGNFKEGKMVMRDELSKQRNGQMAYNQISWEKQEDGSVIQLWLVLDEDGKQLAQLFKGIYKKAG